MNTEQFSRLFPLGSHLCREPMPPMPELKSDMENLKRHGFNLVKLQEHWATDEPSEGQFDFSRYEELIEHASTLDMGVYLGLTCEQAPFWLFRKHPDCRMVGADGYPINYVAATTLPSDGKPGPCFDSPEASALQERFITELVKTLGRFENIVVWNTWQEIGYWSEGLVGKRVCYCPHTLAFFRSWLEERHGDLDALNRRWNTKFPDWDSVYPDTLTVRPSTTAHAAEFAYFMENVQIAKVLESRAAAIRKADPLHRPVFAHKGGPAYASAVDWTYARCQDFLGTSAYPAWGSVVGGWDDSGVRNGEPYDRHTALFNEMWHNLALRFDHMRSCNAKGSPVWAAEFQGGPVSTGLHKGRVPSAPDMRRWLLTTLGCGATAVSFWVTRAEIMAPETNGFSLLDSTGDTSERFEEAARIGAAANRYPDLFARPTATAPQVGILVDERNYRLCGTMGHAREHLSFSTRGWYRMLWEAGVPVGFVDSREIGSGGTDGYRLLVVPFPLSIPEDVVERLATFVDGGGHLVSEACVGRLNEYGFAGRGELSPAAARLFGVAHKSITMVREPETPPRWMPAERTWGEFADFSLLPGVGPFSGAKVSPALYVQTYEPADGTTAFIWNGEPAGVVRAEGGGSALLIGTLVGHQGIAYRGPENPDLVARILSRAGVAASPAGDRGRLLVRTRTTSERQAWFFTNPHADAVTEEIDVSGFAQVEDLLGEPVVRIGDRVNLTVEGLDVRVLILER